MNPLLGKHIDMRLPNRGLLLCELLTSTFSKGKDVGKFPTLSPYSSRYADSIKQVIDLSVYLGILLLNFFCTFYVAANLGT